MSDTIAAACRLVRLPEVRQRTGLSRSTIYRMMTDGSFPASVKLGSRAIAWRSDAIDGWVAARTGLRRDVQR